MRIDDFYDSNISIVCSRFPISSSDTHNTQLEINERLLVTIQHFHHTCNPLNGGTEEGHFSFENNSTSIFSSDTVKIFCEPIRVITYA